MLERNMAYHLKVRLVVSVVTIGLLSATGTSIQRTPEMAKITGQNYLKLMSPGINLGNTLEAIPNQTAWGNPIPNAAIMKSYKAAGFKSLRIPIAWSQYTDAKGKIDPKWMNHTKEVVKLAQSSGLYVLINIHWDGGWLQPTYANRAETEAKFKNFWVQIASAFKAFDHSILFAGTNEVHVTNEYGPPTAENAEVQNGFNQIFVDTVRATGGLNSNRWLVVQSYNTDIDAAVKVNTKLPRDKAKNRLMMEVHYYSPFNFTLNEKSSIWQWGKNAKDPSAKDTWGDEDFVDGQFAKIKKEFVDKGIPVLLGEYGVGLKRNFPGMKAYQLDWDKYVTNSAYRHGMVPMYWDTGADVGMFDRTTGKNREPGRVAAIVAAAK